MLPIVADIFDLTANIGTPAVLFTENKVPVFASSTISNGPTVPLTWRTDEPVPSINTAFVAEDDTLKLPVTKDVPITLEEDETIKLPVTLEVPITLEEDETIKLPDTFTFPEESTPKISFLLMWSLPPPTIK